MKTIQRPTRHCYPCIVELASMTGVAAVGEGDGYGACDNCKVNRRLYRQVKLDAVAAVTPLPTIRRYRSEVRRGQDFGIAILVMAIALGVAVLLATRCGSGAPQTLLDWTNTAIRKLPTYYEDNPPGGIAGRTNEKEAQLSAIALAVAKVAQKAPLPPRQWAALLLTIGFHESTFSLRIHAGHCKPHECDRGRARSPWQLHMNAENKHLWPKLQGIENTDAQVWAADHLLRRVAGTCRPPTSKTGDVRPNMTIHTVAGILTAYAGVRCGVEWKGLAEREATFRRLNP